MTHHNKPLAANGLTSYRYATGHSYVMIGATCIGDALQQAALSTQSPQVENLEIWDSEQGCYQPASY